MPGMKQTVTTIVLAMITVIILTSVAIPMIADSRDRVSGDDDFDVGSDFSYAPEVNIEGATFEFSGSAMDYLEVAEDGKSVSGRLSEKGEFTLTITASTTQPIQTATQTITFSVGVKGDGDKSGAGALMMVIPTMLIIGLILVVIRRFGLNSVSEGAGFGGDGGGFADPGISGGMGSGLSGIWSGLSGLWGGFGKR